jgi:hypothetical protein
VVVGANRWTAYTAVDILRDLLIQHGAIDDNHLNPDTTLTAIIPRDSHFAKAMYNHFQYLAKAMGIRDRITKRNIPATRKALADAGLSVNHVFDLNPVFKLKGVALVPFHSNQAYPDNIT